LVLAIFSAMMACGGCDAAGSTRGESMSTVADAVCRLWWRRFFIFLAIVVAVGLIVFLTGPRVGAVIKALTPPVLPEPIAVSEQVWRGDQSWSAGQAEEFHFKAQGTHTLPIPLSWFLALEAPLNSPLLVPFARRERFVDNRYLLRFGFIGAPWTKANPNGLPIGFAISPYQSIDGISHKETAVGLTCAACHTGQLVFKEKRYVIDGGPAMTDLGQLTLALGAALGQTAISAKLPLLSGRFTRFAKAVLGSEYTDITRNALEKELDAVLQKLAAQPGGVDITEGFSRLDALNRIGNQVFALDPHRYDNYVNINAPVNYPHIWTSSWFSWVQYDGSIMQPLIRNAGEAMGVSAEMNYSAPQGEGRFASSIPFDKLGWIEDQLAGKPPLPDKTFTGLNAPSWPDGFPAIDKAKAAEGAKLYEDLCSGCHRPALTPDVAQGRAPNSDFWTHFGPITWKGKDGQEKHTTESVLNVKIIEQADIGTDPAQSNVLGFRKVDTAGRDLTRAGQASPGLGIDIHVCQENADRTLDTIHISDNAMQLYALALGAVVQMGINEWFRSTGGGESARANIEGDRPNCLAAGFGYKARPLNGVWATAPFLHNGSVPTLEHLLGPVENRPKAFLLGDPTFDPKNVGIVLHQIDEPKGRDYDKTTGYFILDTSKPGNHNTGHEFSKEYSKTKHVPGVVGPALSPDERNAIIEFLKSI
jgi:hypothetical protein